MMVLCMFAESFYPILSQLCATVDARYGERFQFFLEGGYPRLQLASNSLIPRGGGKGGSLISSFSSSL